MNIKPSESRQTVSNILGQNLCGLWTDHDKRAGRAPKYRLRAMIHDPVHARNMVPKIEKALHDAGHRVLKVKFDEIDSVRVVLALPEEK